MEPQIVTKADVEAALRDTLGPLGQEINELRAEVAATKGATLATSNVADLLKGILGDSKDARTQTAESDSLTLSRGVQCLALARFDPVKALSIAKTRYGKGVAVERLERWFESGESNESGFKVKALGSNDFDAGGALAPGGRSNEVIELLRPASVVRASGATEVPLDEGTLTMPMLTGGATATYVGENLAANASQQTVGDMSLTEKQLMIFVPISNKLLRVASVAVDNLIRQDMIASAATKEDVTFLTSDGTQQKPLGLRYLAAAANVNSTSYTTSLANIVTALGAAILLLKNSNVRFIRPGWVFTPSQHLAILMIRDTNGQFVFNQEMTARGTLLGYPFKVTTNMTASNFCFADFADVVIGQATAVTIDASNTAAYTNSSGTVTAAFSADQTIIRLKTSHDLNVRHPESVAWFTNCPWSPA